MREVIGDAPAENSSANSCLQLSDITKLEWGNTSITKKSYVDEGFTAISAAGPDGRLEHFEWSGEGVVLSAIGARCGRCFFVSGKWTAIKNTIVIQGDPAKVNHKFLYYYLNDARKWKISGSGQPFITLKTARETAVPFPPLAVQDEIVAEIEKQFSRLDEAVANLQRVKANLKRYKAAILKAAVEGRLVETEASIARREGRGYETGEQLLQRILEERRKKWVGRGKYKEPELPRAEWTYELPEGWTWATLGHLALSVKDGPHYSPKYASEGVPFVSGGNIRPEGIDFSSTKFISPELHAELSKRCRPEVGDLLYTKGGTTGIARINTDPREFNVWVHVAVLKLASSLVSFYVQHALNSKHCYRQAQEYTHGVGNQDLGLTRMVWITVPLPPVSEQQRIVEEVDRRLSILRGVEADVDGNLQRALVLRQATLAKAFCQ